MPYFEYTDSILNSWLSNNVHYLSDVARLDQAYIQAKESKKQVRKPSKIINNRFDNFESRPIDMDSLEKQLLNLP